MEPARKWLTTDGETFDMFDLWDKIKAIESKLGELNERLDKAYNTHHRNVVMGVVRTEEGMGSTELS